MLLGEVGIMTSAHDADVAEWMGLDVGIEAVILAAADEDAA